MNKTNGTPAARFDAFVVRNFTDKEQKEQSSWMRVGVAFPHKDNKGFNIELEAVPVGGKLVLREHEPKPTPAA